MSEVNNTFLGRELPALLYETTKDRRNALEAAIRVALHLGDVGERGGVSGSHGVGGRKVD